MTLDEFFEKLPRDNWFSGYGGRPTRGHCCPVTAIDPAQPTPGNWVDVAKRWHLDTHLAGEIVKAADSIRGHDPALRARLLAHCGLTETK